MQVIMVRTKSVLDIVSEKKEEKGKCCDKFPTRSRNICMYALTLLVFFITPLLFMMMAAVTQFPSTEDIDAVATNARLL